jgi:hypothetical protein
VVFGAQTVLRLVAVLKGLIPAATAVLLLSGLISGGAAIGGSTLSFMGLALGALVGIPAGHWLALQTTQEADRRLPLVLSLVFLPLAMLPTQPEVLGVSRFGFHGWFPLLGLAVAFPMGITSGCSWLDLDECRPGTGDPPRLRRGIGPVLVQGSLAGQSLRRPPGVAGASLTGRPQPPGPDDTHPGGDPVCHVSAVCVT